MSVCMYVCLSVCVFTPKACGVMWILDNNVYFCSECSDEGSCSERGGGGGTLRYQDKFL